MIRKESQGLQHLRAERLDHHIISVDLQFCERLYLAFDIEALLRFSRLR